MLVVLLTLVFLLLLSNYIIIQSQSGDIFRDPDLLSTTTSLVILGTSPFLRGGSPNPFFHGRINSAHQLFLTGNIEKIIVSGSQELPFYNEPAAMKQALIDKGIDQDLIIKDVTGLDTFRSLFALKNTINPNETFVIVTQEFHAYRALFIAEQLGYNALAFGSPNILGVSGVSIELREIFARLKAVLDVVSFRIGIFNEHL